MGIGKQAKILTNKQQELLLTYLEKSRYPLRNKVMLLFSFKAGLRAKEIAAVTWSMVCNADGKIGTEINLTNNIMLCYIICTESLCFVRSITDVRF